MCWLDLKISWSLFKVSQLLLKVSVVTFRSVLGSSYGHVAPYVSTLYTANIQFWGMHSVLWLSPFLDNSGSEYECFAVLDDESGSFNTPNFPNNYPSNAGSDRFFSTSIYPSYTTSDQTRITPNYPQQTKRWKQKLKMKDWSTIHIQRWRVKDCFQFPLTVDYMTR